MELLIDKGETDVLINTSYSMWKSVEKQKKTEYIFISIINYNIILN